MNTDICFMPRHPEDRVLRCLRIMQSCILQRDILTVISELSVNFFKRSCLNFLLLIASLSDITRTQSSNMYRVVLVDVMMLLMMSSVIDVNGIAGPVGSPHIHIRSAKVPPLMMPPQRSTMRKIVEVVSMSLLIRSVPTLVIVNIFLRLLRTGCEPRPDDEPGFNVRTNTWSSYYFLTRLIILLLRSNPS